MDRAKVISVDIAETPHGLLRATSAQERGLQVAGVTLAGVKTSVKWVLQELYLARGHDVSVYEADSPSDYSHTWVIVPNGLNAAC